MTKHDDAHEEPAKTNLIGPGDRLTDAQAIRLHTAVALGKAWVAALEAGMSVAELEAQEWLIDVKLLDPSERGAPAVGGALIHAAEVAGMLSVQTSWVYSAARDGRLPCVRIGRHVRFERHVIDAWIAAGGDPSM